MKSEFDNLLGWPFKSSIKFKLVNQQKPGYDKIETFNPDQQSTSFKKPKNDMSIASGCPMFISINSFKNDGFVKDDCIFIEIDVGIDN